MATVIMIVLFYIFIALPNAKTEILHSRHYDATLQTDIKDQISNDAVLGLVTGISKLHCSLKCMNSRDCLSFSYVREDRECRIHRGTLSPILNQLEHRNGAKYYKLVVQTGYRKIAKLIGDSCQNSEECSVEQSECRGGKCLCKAGYSFLASNKSCDEDCAHFGSVFTQFTNKKIDGHVKQQRLAVWSQGSCAHLCKTTWFTCRSFDYDYVWSVCYLRDVDASNFPNAYQYSSYSHYYQRNCN